MIGSIESVIASRKGVPFFARTNIINKPSVAESLYNQLGSIIFLLGGIFVSSYVMSEQISKLLNIAYV
jgi:hypothetical protein